MSIIDGIGDEVTYLFIAVTAATIAAVAWITTDIRQNLYVRTVYLLEHSGHQMRVATLTNHTESATISEGLALDSTEPEEEIAVGAMAVVGDDDDDDDDDDDIRDQGEDPLIEDIVETMDAASSEGSTASILRQRRLQWFRNDANSQQQSIIDTGVTTTGVADEGAPITIKLKFIDDNLKIVDAQLQELLGDFKRRHFDVEMASNKNVRLIFNGQVLQHDQHTLESYGMFDNCVVHCLVQQTRSSSSNAGETPARPESSSSSGSSRVPISSNSAQVPRDWDLGNLLFVTLTFTLGSVWYFRLQHPHLFTVWTTMGLIGLTSGLGVMALVRYFPEILAREIIVAQ